MYRYHELSPRVAGAFFRFSTPHNTNLSPHKSEESQQIHHHYHHHPLRTVLETLDLFRFPC
jgi:hypothetical protein